MGYAVRADDNEARHVQASPDQSLVSLDAARGLQPTAETAASRVSAAAAPHPTTPAEVRQLPKTPRLPLGLKIFVGVQQGSTVLTGGLVAAALVIYSWTVYLDKAVVRSLRQLETLKVSTQQVTTANETLKHSMAEQAESPAAGYVPFKSKRAIFLAPAPTRPSPEPTPEVTEPEVPTAMPHPLGY